MRASLQKRLRAASSARVPAGKTFSATCRPSPLVLCPNGSWKLEYALFDEAAATQNFVTFATGSGPVSNATLATFDPTVLLNGTYQIRLTATDAVGQFSATAATLSVSRNMKVGVFTLSFNDLSVPMPGLLIQITRTYDSRDKRAGDFGVGWRVSINNVRLQKSRNIGLSWSEDFQYSGLLPVYCLQPTSPRIITITFPDGKVYKLQATVTPQCQQAGPITAPTVTFTQLPGPAGTAGATLAALDGRSALVDGAVPGPVNLVGFDANLYNPGSSNSPRRRA